MKRLRQSSLFILPLFFFYLMTNDDFYRAIGAQVTELKGQAKQLADALQFAKETGTPRPQDEAKLAAINNQIKIYETALAKRGIK